MQSINLIIFPEKTSTKAKSAVKPEPNWAYLFFLRFKPEFQEKIIAFAEKTQSSYSLFLQGLSKEYGVLARKNLTQALSSYKEGAELNDAFCHFKLYYIFNEDYQKYHIQRNRDLAISHLLQAAVFWDPYCSNHDLLAHLDPKMLLGMLLENEDDKLVKIRLIIHKFFKTNSVKYNFFTNWVMVEYPFEADLSEFHFAELVMFVENTEYPEGCFYYGKHLLETYRKDKTPEGFTRAEEMLLVAIKANVIKAHYPLAILYEENGMTSEALNTLKKGAKFGCSSCLESLSSYYSIGMKTARDFAKASKYAYRAFLLGNLTAGHTFKDIGCYMKSVGLENRVEDLDRKIFLIAENLSEILSDFNPTLQNVGANLYLLAKCYIDGINCSPNFKRALEIITDGMENQNVEDKKYLIYTKGRVLMKMGFDCQEVMNNAFKFYEDFIKNEKNKKFPQHYYRIGKFLEFGWGVGKNHTLAREFYKKGMTCVEEKPNMSWMQYLYMQKCKTKLKDIAIECTLE